MGCMNSLRLITAQSLSCLSFQLQVWPCNLLALADGTLVNLMQAEVPRREKDGLFLTPFLKHCQCKLACWKEVGGVEDSQGIPAEATVD